MPDGSWTAKTDMPAPGRAVMANYKLADNKIYVAGGSKSSNSVCRDHDEYAILGDFWTSMVDIPPPDRARCMGLALGPDTGYLVGGRTGSSIYYDYCIEYSQASGVWATRANLPLNKGGGNSWVIDNDRGIVTAGSKGSGSSGLAPQTYEYTKSTDTWAVKTNIIPPSRESAAGFCIQGKGYVCGGGSTTSGLTSTAGDLYDTDEYDNATDSWASLTDMINPARGMAGGESLASSGNGYIAGGSQGTVKGYKDCDEFNPSANNWIIKTDIPVTRNEATVCAGSDNTMYIIGSYVNPTSYTSVYEFTMPKAPWVANLSPGHEQIDVPVDSNILFNIFDDVGVDPNTITVKVGDSYAIVGGVFQTGFTGTITEIV